LCEGLHFKQVWRAYVPKSGLHIYRIKKPCQGFFRYFLAFKGAWNP